MSGGRSRLEVGRWLPFHHHYFHHRVHASGSREMLRMCQKPDRDGGHVTYLSSRKPMLPLLARGLLIPPYHEVF